MKLIDDLGTRRVSCKTTARYGIFECEYCGTRKEKKFTYSNLPDGIKCRSCSNREKSTLPKKYKEKINGVTASKSRIYRTWKQMKSRCQNKNVEFYYRYGGRGISVCEEWKNNFLSFKDWSISNGYSDDLSIDRIDPNGNYEPSNCRWATDKQQAINRNKRYSQSGFIGVTEKNNKFSCRVWTGDKRVHLGTYESKEYCSMLYDTYCIVYGLKNTTNYPRGIFQ